MIFNNNFSYKLALLFMAGCLCYSPISFSKETKPSLIEKFFLWTNKPSLRSERQKTKKALLARTVANSNQEANTNEKSSDSKEDFLPADYYTAEKSETVLSKEFETHIENIKKVCKAEKNRDKKLQTHLKNFILFLEESLKDPYMNYGLILTFGDVLGLLTEDSGQNLIKAENFALSYRFLYNLPDDTKAEDYPSPWAQTIHKTLKCVEETKTN